MATVAGGYKINGAVNGSTNIGNGSYTLYTAPADGYAIVQLSALVTTAAYSPANWYVAVSAGYIVLPTSLAAASTSNTNYFGIYVGPSQSVVLNISYSGLAAPSTGFYLTGVEFKNI